MSRYCPSAAAPDRAAVNPSRSYRLLNVDAMGRERTGPSPDLQSARSRRECGLSTFEDEVFAWFTDQSGPDLSRKRGLAWLETPNALVAATTLASGLADPAELLEKARTEVTRSSALPEWQSPKEAEAYLRQLLRRGLP